MAKYKIVSQQVRAKFDALTPLVEPLSVDEAFLDLSGTETLTGLSPAEQLLRLSQEIETEIGITVSVGLSFNKFLAKLASDMEKPRGFTVIGKQDCIETLAPLAIARCPGIGPKSASSLRKDGLITLGQIQSMDKDHLIKRYGDTGLRLFRLAHGIDNRIVKNERDAKSVSAETTLSKDIYNIEDLERVLLSQCERVSADLKRKDFVGTTINLKVKTDRHKIISRSYTRQKPTHMAHEIFDTCKKLLAPLADGTGYRLVGAGVSNIQMADETSGQLDMMEDDKIRQNKTEAALDKIREKFGADTIVKGRLYKPGKKDQP